MKTRPSLPRSTGRTCRRSGRRAWTSSRGAERIATTIASAASRPGTTERRIAERTPTAATRPSASSGPPDRAQVVHRPLEAVGASVGARRHDVGELRAPCRHAQPARDPGARPKDADLPCRSRPRRSRVERRGLRVAAHRRRAPALRVVGERAAREPGGSGEPVGDAFDHAERGRGNTERRGEETRQKRRGGTVAEIRERLAPPIAPTPGVSHARSLSSRSRGRSLAASTSGA